MRISLFFVSMLLLISNLNSQKAKCKLNKIKDRYNLVILIDSHGLRKAAGPDCSASALVNLSDSVRLSLMQELLSYRTNTALSVRSVGILNPKSRELKRPQATTYRIQVESLILINILALGSDAFRFSPFPVLFDLRTGRELDSDQFRINEIYAIYTSWVNGLVQSKGKNFSTPDLSEVGIQWFARAPFRNEYEKLGSWDERYDCIELE